MPFNEADFEKFSGSGSGSVKGQSFLTNVGGDVKTAAGKFDFRTFSGVVGQRRPKCRAVSRFRRGRLHLDLTETAGVAKKLPETGRFRASKMCESRSKTVYLMPETSYTEEWYSRSYIGGEMLPNDDPAIAKYLRTATADASGNFEFDSLPVGDYFVRCFIFWDPGDGSTTGGEICQRVHVVADQVCKIVLTK